MKFQEIDKRNFSANRATDERQNQLSLAAEEVSENLPGSHNIKIDKFDKTTGNFAEIISESAPIPQDPKEKTNYVKRAEQYLQALSPALGFEKTQPAEFKLDPVVQSTSANSKIVHAHQTYQSLDIFQSGTSVRFDSTDAIKGVAGNVVTIDQNIEPLPKLTAKDAVKIAGRLVAKQPTTEQKDPFGEPIQFESLNLDGFEPEIDVALEDDPSMTTFFKPGPFSDRIKSRLIWFELSPGDLRLAWEIITTQMNALRYRTIVDATKPMSQIQNERDSVLYNKVLTQFLQCRMNVYTVNGGKPREMVDCPIPTDRYPVRPVSLLPSEFPDHWNDDNNNTTVGNCTFAHLGTSPQVYTGIKENNMLIFNPTDPKGDEQKILNIFYLNCYMHDFFYILGFDEKNANFQRKNLGRGGKESDRVDSRAHSGSVFGTANMGTPADGLSPSMNMGLVTSVNRHTAFDSDVVFHEFMHGVTNRLVGGGTLTDALDSPQSGMMGEGWGDYIACTINKKEVVGDWVINDPAGIRTHPYNADYPVNFGDLPTVPEVHDGGEVWCATLLEMNRNIKDDNMSAQLVVDALKISQPNPSFLNMRDSILTALDDKLDSNQITPKKHKDIRAAIWKSFAKFGMGPNAQTNGAQLDGIVADFNTPP